jgi:hypothetical protein
MRCDGWRGRGAGRVNRRGDWRQLRTEGAWKGEEWWGEVVSGVGEGSSGSGASARRVVVPVWVCDWWSVLRVSVMPSHRGAGFRGRGWVPGLGPGASERGSPRTPSPGGRARAPRGERLGRRRRRRRAAAWGRFRGAGLSRAEAYGPASPRSPGAPAGAGPLSGGAQMAQQLLQGEAAVESVRSPTCANPSKAGGWSERAG